MEKTKRKQKEIKNDYIKEYLDYAKINKELLSVEALEAGLRVAKKKQKEYETIGKSCMRLADHIELEFEFTDEEKIMNSIKKTQRDLGLLQDDEFKKMFSEFTPYQVKSYHERRKMIFEEKRTYSVSFTKNGTIATIGTPNLEALARFIALNMRDTGLDNLSADTQTTLFFHKFK
jgi:hypothetical protein